VGIVCVVFLVLNPNKWYPELLVLILEAVLKVVLALQDVKLSFKWSLSHEPSNLDSEEL
jgi:hypothetical protein